ncbi:MAG: peptide chain release factor N(5)-glutamine methyltransferase [Gammaproteobacteria bacterium]|nr:peptide chain release factor N(5)-glutamine methyltransferase [Gammaproteobacteria bacterium]
MKTIKELIDSNLTKFPDRDCALMDAEILTAHALSHSRSWVKASIGDALTEQQINAISLLFDRRIKGEPVAYILEEWEFYSIPLKVSPATLIPRPETEHLVERCIEIMANIESLSILDLGTGTGAIAIALAKNVHNASVTALDFSAEALEVARSNALTNQVDVEFRHSDWFEAVNEHERFDLIVSNPPYVAFDDPHLSRGDLRFEPQSALTAGEDEFSDLKTIINDAGLYLNIGGALLVEHGYDQGTFVRELFTRAGFTDVKTHQDYSGNDRFTEGYLA